MLLRPSGELRSTLTHSTPFGGGLRPTEIRSCSPFNTSTTERPMRPVAPVMNIRCLLIEGYVAFLHALRPLSVRDEPRQGDRRAAVYGAGPQARRSRQERGL